MPLEANLFVQTPLASFSSLELSFPINTLCPVSFYQLNIMSEFDIPQAIPNNEFKTASLALSSPPVLLTLLLIYSQVF